MPNYRHKNRNRNKNKQRIKQQQQQQQQEQQNQKGENYKKESEETASPTSTTGRRSQTPPSRTPACETDARESASHWENNVADVNTSCTEKSTESNVCALRKVPDVTTATTAAETETKATETNDTVSIEPSQCDDKSENQHSVQANDTMGNEKSKISHNQRESNIVESVETQRNSHPAATNVTTLPPSTSALGKVIVHTIVCEASNCIETNKDRTNLNESAHQDATESNISCITESPNNEREVERPAAPQDDSNMQRQQTKIIVPEVLSGNLAADLAVSQDNPSNGDSTERDKSKIAPEKDNRIILHKIATQNDDAKTQDDPEARQHITESLGQHQAKVIVHQVYLEDKDEPTASGVRIVEISDESLSDLEELRSPVISEAESSVEYSDDSQQQLVESITEVSSLSSISNTQKQSRKQKRIALEHHFLPQMLSPRYLDSISEENSEFSESSDNPLSRSASTDSATNCNTEGKVQKLNTKYPKSSLDFSKSHKQNSSHNRKPKVIREETVAVTVAARLQDAPNADESCSTVRSCLSPEAEAAEVVFIDSASSSMSDLHDIESYENSLTTAATEFNLDTDLKDIMTKPVTADNKCFESLTSPVVSSSPAPSSPPAASNFTAKTPQQQLLQFGATPNNSYENNEAMSNCEFINNSSIQTSPHTTSKTDKIAKTRSLAETNTKLNANSETDLILLSSPPSSLANDQLVFAQIEEQISSVLSSINEAASQYTTTSTSTSTVTTKTTTASESESVSASASSTSPSPSSLLSSSSSPKTQTNISNTLKLPVATTSTTASSGTVETSSEEPFNTSRSSSCSDHSARTPRAFSPDLNMNNVREIIFNNNANENTGKSDGNNENCAANANGFVQLCYNNSNTFTPIPPLRASPPPPPVPPPPSQEHQLQPSYDECDSNLASEFPPFTSAYSSSLPLLQKNVDNHNVQTEPHHDFPRSFSSALSPPTSSVARQESMDSPCSDSTSLSQCTAINVATEQTDKSDLVQTSSFSDLKTNTTQRPSSLPADTNSVSPADPKKLRLLCTETLASFPYGDVVLEELATVAQSIGEARAFKALHHEEKMPYPLPELPHIDDLQLSLKVGKPVSDRLDPASQNQSWLGVPTNTDPKVLVCLSPSQRSYIQQRPQQKPDELLDAHQKFVERRGYHEYTKEQLQALEREKLAEQQLLQTAAKMKKLRKSITPSPPQIPPPPVPVKSSETASKAQHLSNRTATTTALGNTQKTSNDVILANVNEQMPAASNGEINGEENKHRLLSIIQDTCDSNSNKHIHSVDSSPSSAENNSRRIANCASAPAKEQVPPTTTSTSTFGNGNLSNAYQFIHKPKYRGVSNMQGVETTLGQMFPTMGYSNIFDQEHKRFSNIESSKAEPFCSQIVNTQPKRYSSIETHCYETQKRIENGKLVDDFSTSKHEMQTAGDKPSDIKSFPFAVDTKSFLHLDNEQDNSAHHKNDQEIMSALNLTKHSSDIERKQQSATEITITTNTTEGCQNNKSVRPNENGSTENGEPESSIPKRETQNTYEEIRQHANAATDNVATLPSLDSASTAAPTAKLAVNVDNVETISSSMSSKSTTTETVQRHKTTHNSYDQEKLFKEFDDLSKQLHRELETSKAEREQREKSASMFDLNKLNLRQKQQIEEFNKTRHEHFKELEHEIERSMRSRSLKLTRPQELATDVGHRQIGRTYEIPIHIENGHSPVPAASASANSKSTGAYEMAPPIPEYPKTYQIPIETENSKSHYVDDNRSRRAESMFNMSDDLQRANQSPIHRAEDDWSKYASDLGSSENITRPFAKEVAICYQRRPGGIRAPRLTASTNDLSFNNHHFYDQCNAYNVKRHHAPMLNKAPEQSRPKFGSCYSLIERDPNPKYISTTTRRGVSPAAQSTGFFPLDGCHVREEDIHQRRASLPRELHDQQLKYICNKEEELRLEFERLQSERRRLMEEAQKAQTGQMTQAQASPMQHAASSRSLRDHYRATQQKLPTLTEDEVFRQQMAEEWLSKVAERENRRLQNIIKISKIHEDELSSKSKADMGEEFLSRVKERRHKLAMPADSDWESGAESQPTLQAHLSEAEDVPPVKIIEGEKEANLRRLPRHLREFAKFSNHQKEKIEGGHREEHQEEERCEEATDNSVSRAIKKSSVVKTVKTLRAPMMPEKHGHDTKSHYQKSRVHQTAVHPRDPPLSDRIQRRTNKQTRFAVTNNRRSWSESDLLQEIDKDLKLAKGFLFQDEKAQSPSMFAPKFKAKAPTGTGIWSPKTQTPTSSLSNLSELNKSIPPTPPLQPVQPVWACQPSPQSNRKEFRPVRFESPTLPRKYVISTSTETTLPPWSRPSSDNEVQTRLPQSCVNLSTTTSVFSEASNGLARVGSSNSIATVLPKSSISEKIKTFERSASASDLYNRPQIKRLADRSRPICKPNEIIYNVKQEYMSEPETGNERPRKMAQLGRRQYDGIGPITNDGMPIILRSEVKEPHQHEWYKRLYQTIHKQKHGGRCHQYNKPNGYLSEPEPNYDSDYSTIKYRTINPNRLQSVSSSLNVRKSNDTLYGSLPNPVKSGHYSYRNQPGRIEDYVTGYSSVSEKEKKEWWDEVMDIFNVQLDQAKLSSHYTEGNLSRALAKESGYTSDSNLVFRKKQVQPSSALSPVEQKQAYKSVQAGGEPPLFGFRKPAPEKSKEPKKRKSNIPPPPPNRNSLYAKCKPRKSAKGIPIPSSSASRHEKCFQHPESPVLGAANKYTTLTLRKISRKAPLCRSKSAGAAAPLKPLENKITLFRRQVFPRATSPLAKQKQSAPQRHTSRSPVAFGRSVSKERTFAEEKKRLESTLPLSRYTFEASTNILRDPTLKSAQDVKKAVRTLAACAVQARSHSVPRFCSGCRSQAHFYHTIYLPDSSHYSYTEWLASPSQCGRADKKAKVQKLPSGKQMVKASSNASLAASNSTFSLEQTSPNVTSKPKDAKASTKTPASSKACKKVAKEKTKNKRFSTDKSEARPKKITHEVSYVCRRLNSPTSTITETQADDVTRNIKFEEPFDNCNSTVRDRTDFWNDFNIQQSASLPYVGSKRLLPNYMANASGHKSRSLSPYHNRLQSAESKPAVTADSGYTEASDVHSKKEERGFSPTREVRVPPYLTRSVRSPSRRRIDSCRSNHTNKVIRASSLSSAEDRSLRGLYLCDELAHSATSLASNDRHSPTCRYLHNSERFEELNRFYSTLERVGQLEKCTSKTDFKPIRKESDLLDYEEWRQVRLHERAEKELNYLVSKLKEEQQAQKFLFLPKDVNDVKWRKEHDVGLNSREKSVEDLRENFESINFLQDYIDRRNKLCCNTKYWRRNTVADLAQTLEAKLQKDNAIGRDSSPATDTHFSEQLVRTLPKDQIQKINQQLSDIYSDEQNQPTENVDEKFVVTVEHNTMPSPSQALRVRCKSSITRDELLGSVLKRKNVLTNINLNKHNDAAVKHKKNKEGHKKDGNEEDCQEPPEIPPAPNMDYRECKENCQREELQAKKDAKDISDKIKYFEERKYDTPSKTIYRAREDSSPDEDEVMKLIEEKIRLKQYRNHNQHKELSNSLTDLCGIFGERNSSRTNFHANSPPQRAADDGRDDISETYQRSETYSPYSSLELFETCYRSRSASPQSQCSSYLQRVNTGEVQKIREKFESLGYDNMKPDHFFGLSKLRKVRSDPEMNTINSESKDTLLNGDVSWITHKFEMQNKLLKPIKENTEPRRGRKRLMLSPTPLTNRLMPHIDRISKTAVLGNIQAKQERSQSPTRSLSSSSGIVERLKVRYENQKSKDIQCQLSHSQPDIRNPKHYIPQYLTANWVAHRYPSPTDNQVVDTVIQSKPKKGTTCLQSAFKASPSKCTRHTTSQDIFANQIFDPKIHTPKARYIPDGAETKPKQLPRLQWSPLTPKRVHAVTFQDYDFSNPQLPPPPKGELLEHRAVSPSRYYESDVNIHFKTPVRQEYKYHLSEEELAIRQAEHMQKLYQEERRRKYLQELQDMNSRRHTDNFTPSQKSPIPLNRYDDFPADLAPKTSHQVKSVARALYNFQAQNSKELSFKKGDIIYIKRAIDKNWFEGEHNAMIGLFPANYVEIINKETVYAVQPPASVYRKPSEGQARAKYNFQAQSGVELSLNKGELVALTRRVDDNWFEGRIANRKGIFPVSYVEVLTDIGAEDIAARTTTIQQVSVVNGRPSLDAMRTNINNEFNTITRNGNQPPNTILRETRNVHKTDILHVDTSSEPLVYRALYKYRPQNSDELELQEGDIVHVLEKCDDGWYVGTSQRTGCFGTFPGNYVDRI